MKLVLFGNTNNYPLLLAQGFRRNGVDAHLVVTRAEMLHRPEYSEPSLIKAYGDWIHDLSRYDEESYAEEALVAAEARLLFDEADGVLLNHLGPSLRAHYDGPAIAFLTGSDLDYYANFRTLHHRSESWHESYRSTDSAAAYTERWRALIERQRAGIRHCDAVSFFPRGLIRAGDDLLDAIGVRDAQRFHIYFGDTETIPYRPPRAADGATRIFCGARLTWVQPRVAGSSELDYKGTDIMLRGVASLLKSTSRDGRSPAIELRLVEKGAHVTQTKALATELGLQSRVTWLPEISRRQFLAELVAADICIDNLGESVIGMAGLDAMASGRPLIANDRLTACGGTSLGPSPVCHAHTPDQVAAHLSRLIDDPEERVRVGVASREFVLRHWSPSANARSCLERLGLYDRCAPSANQG